MKICITVFAAGGQLYYNYTLPRLKHWAERMGADLYIIDQCGEEYPDGLFDKLFAPHRFPGYDRYLLIDADVIPNRYTNHFDSLVRPEYDIQVCLDPYMPAVGGCESERIRAEPLGDKLVPGDPYYNAGILSLSPRAAAAMWRTRPPYIAGWLTEQNWLNLWIRDVLPCHFPDLSMRVMQRRFNYPVAYPAGVGDGLDDCVLAHFFWKHLIPDEANRLYPINEQRKFHDLVTRSYVINLRRRRERLDSVMVQFDKVGIEPHLKVATDASKQGPMSRDASFLNPASRALADTMVEIFEEAIALQLPSVAIFEDDVIFAPDFQDRFDALDIPRDWQMLYLGGLHKKPLSLVNEKVGRVTCTYDAHATIYQYRDYQPLIDVLTMDYDWAVQSDVRISYLQPYRPTYACSPNLVWQSFHESDVAGKAYSNYNQLTGAQL